MGQTVSIILILIYITSIVHFVYTFDVLKNSNATVPRLLLLSVAMVYLAWIYFIAIPFIHLYVYLGKKNEKI